MEFLSPIFIPKPLAPINDQNLKKGRPVFLFKGQYEPQFSDYVVHIYEHVYLTHLIASK